MTTFAENIEKFSDLQKQGFEPVRDFAVFAADAFEKLARKNYAVYGDVLDFAVAQAKLPIEVAEPKELLAQQIESSKALAEVLTNRANEYVELSKELRETSAALFERRVAEPTKAAPKKAA